MTTSPTKAKLEPAKPAAPTRKLPTADGGELREIVKVSFISMPAGLFEVSAAVIVYNHADHVPDMEPAIHLSAWVISVLLIGIYHIAHQLDSGFLRDLSLLGKSFLAIVLMLVLWDLSLPHDVFFEGTFVTTEPAPPLSTSAIVVCATTAALWAHSLVIRRFKRPGK